jgi:hypothetical protein
MRCFPPIVEIGNGWDSGRCILLAIGYGGNTSEGTLSWSIFDSPQKKNNPFSSYDYGPYMFADY